MRGSDFLGWRIGAFFLGAVVGLAGIFLDNPWLVTAALIVLLVGVAVRDLVTLSKSTAPPTHDALIRLEPHHTHFVLVPGSRWGDESPILVDTARHLAIGATPVVVLVNGGDVAWKDVTESVDAGLPVIVIGGTGRVADQLAAAIAGDDSDPRAVKLANSGLLQSLSLSECAEKLPVVLKKALSR